MRWRNEEGEFLSCSCVPCCFFLGMLRQGVFLRKVEGKLVDDCTDTPKLVVDLQAVFLLAQVQHPVAKFCREVRTH